MEVLYVFFLYVFSEKMGGAELGRKGRGEQGGVWIADGTEKWYNHQEGGGKGVG